MEQKEVLITLIRHANYDDDAGFPINKSEYVRTFFAGKLIANKCGPVDAIFSSTADRATETAKVLAIATSCGNVVQKDDLWQDTARDKFMACLAEIREDALEKGQKHVIIVMHLPCFWKLDIASMDNLDFMSTTDFTVINYCRRNRVSPTGACNEDFNLLTKQILPMQTPEEIISLLMLFQKNEGLEDVKNLIKKWKRDFLDVVGITDLNEEASWVEIVTHYKCDGINILRTFDIIFSKNGSFSYQQSALIHKFLPGYEETKTIFADKNLQFGGYFSFINQRPNIHCAKIATLQNLEAFEANPFVSSEYAEKMKGIDIVVIIPDLGRICFFSFATQKSVRFLKAVEEEKKKMLERQNLDDDLPF